MANITVSNGTKASKVVNASAEATLGRRSILIRARMRRINVRLQSVVGVEVLITLKPI